MQRQILKQYSDVFFWRKRDTDIDKWQTAKLKEYGRKKIPEDEM